MSLPIGFFVQAPREKKATLTLENPRNVAA
jgi:hypothetical protein